MSECSQCGCALPGIEHLCQKCYDAKHPELGHPKSYLESTWFLLCYAIFGIGLMWGWVVELTSGQSKPRHQSFYVAGWAVFMLFRVRYAAIGNKRRVGRLPDWCFVVFCFLIGLPFNWACAFLWFSRRYAFFSGPVVGVTGLIVALYAAIGVLVRLTGGRRIALGVFAVASVIPSAIVWRLDLPSVSV
jgi:hypothetical protein